MTKTQTDLKNSNEILRMAMDNELEAWQIEGVLNDEWLIEDYDHTISINGRRSDYIILTYEFLHSWGNTLYVIQTNDRKVYDEYMERYEEYLESLEYEELEEIDENLAGDIVEAINEERHEIYSGYYFGEKYEVDREVLSTFDEIYKVGDDHVIGLRLR